MEKKQFTVRLEAKLLKQVKKWSISSGVKLEAIADEAFRLLLASRAEPGK